MKTINQIGTILGAVAILSLGACATPSNNVTTPVGSSNQSATTGAGTVQSVELIKHDTNSGIGLGTIAGAVIGGVVGNQVGEGKGNTAATVIGAAGGAYAGNKIENSRRQQSADSYKITLRMDNGTYQSFEQSTDGGLRVGDRAWVNNGTVQRY